MATPANSRSTKNAVPEPATLPQQWARNMQEFSRWQLVLLDAQTAWWKDMERGAIDLMTPWLAKPPPSLAQPVLERPQQLPAPAWPVDAQQAWKAWGQVWMSALGHDTSPTDTPPIRR